MRITITQSDELLAHAMANHLGTIIGQVPIVGKCGRETRVFVFEATVFPGHDDVTVLESIYALFNGGYGDSYMPRLQKAYSEAGLCSLCIGHVVSLEDRKYICQPEGWGRVS